MDLQLKGKIALITGSSSGLGLATALLLTQEGAKVAMNGRNAEKLEHAANTIRRAAGMFWRSRQMLPVMKPRRN